MARTNGKTEVEERNLDVEHELPASDETENQSVLASAVTENLDDTNTDPLGNPIPKLKL